MKSVKLAVVATVLAVSIAAAVGVDRLPAGEAEPMVTDGEIAMIAVVAGNLDVRYAHLALAFSSDETVRSFAKTMIQDHPAVNEAAGALVSRLGIAPVPSDVSRQLEAQGAEIIAELVELRGAEFDRRYAANELAYHQFVNTALREQFIPGAQHEEFRAALEGALTVFEGHEELAENMVRSVNE